MSSPSTAAPLHQPLPRSPCPHLLKGDAQVDVHRISGVGVQQDVLQVGADRGPGDGLPGTCPDRVFMQAAGPR